MKHLAAPEIRELLRDDPGETALMTDKELEEWALIVDRAAWLLVQSFRTKKLAEKEQIAS